MATLSAPTARVDEDRFLVALGAVCAAIAFGGFAGTYWLQLVPGTFVGSPLVHLHGLLFSLWTLFFVWQAYLIAQGKRSKHRAWGLIGISLATAMVFTGLAVAKAALNERLGWGQGDAARSFMIIPITSVPLFAGLVLGAMVERRRQDWHKRLMLSATASLLQPAIGRLFFMIKTGGGPGLRPGLGPARTVESSAIYGFIADVVIIAAMAYDWRTRGRVHPAYWWGLGAILLVQLGRIPFSKTQAWLNFADYFANFSS